MIEGLTGARLVIGLIFLVIASAQDIKNRMVKDVVWMVLGSLAILFLIAQLVSDINIIKWEYFLILIPTAFLFFDVFWDREAIFQDGKFYFVPLPIFLYVLSFLIMIWLFVSFYTDYYFLHLFTVPMMILVCYGLYYSGLLKGGADAKALICIAILMPYYPVLQGYPLIVIEPQFLDVTSVLFPFAFVVLLNASLLLVFYPLMLLIYNIGKRSVKFPLALFGYKVDIDNVPRFTWLMEHMEDDKLRVSIFPKRNENKMEDLRKLKEFGKKEVWITPQLPFIVPLTLGFIVSFIIGNIFMGIVYLLT